MNKYKEILEKIPELLNSGDEPDICFEKVLTLLGETVKFDCAYVCYLNSYSANIKYKKENGCSLFDKNTALLEITPEIKKELFDTEPVIFNDNSDIAKAFGMSGYNFLMSKLLISKTVFGIILLASKSEFNQEDTDIAKAFSALASYTIKDSELSNVFKLQLKALQESVIDKSAAHATIKEQNEKILEADKVKSEFLANTSHELRTPLNAIIGFSEVLTKQLFGPLNEKQTEYINDIHVSGLHLLGMINEILEISKIESKALKLTPSHFNLKVSLGEVVNIVQPLADKKKIHLNKNAADDIEIYADYQKVQQIMYNLLSNAIKFTEEGGHVEAGYSVSEDFVEIYVKDDGIGIDKKYHEKIFEKFVQLNNIYCKKESSTGLGLTITKELTELHGGNIRFESEPHKGSSFYVSLPL